MKLNRRSFMKVLAALAPSPLIARDMGDFDFLDTPGIPQQVTPPVIPVVEPKIIDTKSWSGDLRYNQTTSKIQFYDGQKWRNLNETTNSN